MIARSSGNDRVSVPLSKVQRLLEARSCRVRMFQVTDPETYGRILELAAVLDHLSRSLVAWSEMKVKSNVGESQ